MANGEGTINRILRSPLQVVNLGLEGFAQALKERGVSVVHVEWSPPAGGNPRLRSLLSKLRT